MPVRVVRGVVAALLALVVLAGLVASPTSGSAEASSTAPPTTVLSRGDELGNSLPKPNSGTEPRTSGDRGGSAQVALFGVMAAGTAFIAVMVVREVRRSRRRLEAARSS